MLSSLRKYWRRNPAKVFAIVALSALIQGAGSTVLLFGQAPAGTSSFEGFLAQVERAQVELVRGRPDAFKALWSHRDDVTLVGGLGGPIEKGWALVSKRLDWVSTQYADGSRTHSEISCVVGPELAYVVQRETLRFRVPGETREVTRDLRTTMVFRVESGRWRLVHRHADSQITRAPGQ